MCEMTRRVERNLYHKLSSVVPLIQCNVTVVPTSSKLCCAVYIVDLHLPLSSVVSPSSSPLTTLLDEMGYN